MSFLLNPYRLAAGGASSYDGSITVGVVSDSWTEVISNEGGTSTVDHFLVDKGFTIAGITTNGTAIGSISSNTYSGKTIAGCYTEEIDGVLGFVLVIAVSGSPLGSGAITSVTVGDHVLTGLSYFNSGPYEQWYLTSPPALFGSVGDVVSLSINV